MLPTIDEGDRNLLGIRLQQARRRVDESRLPAHIQFGTHLGNNLFGELTQMAAGAREHHDAGSRITRAIPLDELLLQLTESLRKSMTL